MADASDLIIIGGGPAGYTAAVRGAQLGLSVTLIEKRPTLGGTCLNVGCIPSKALLESSELYAIAEHEFDNHGISTGDVGISVKKMMARKVAIVNELTTGIDYLMKKNKVTRLHGTGRLKSGTEVIVTAEDGTETVHTAKNILIAAGSVAVELPGAPFDEERILSSTGALALKKVPKKMIVVGGGVIGLELGSVWSRLGSEVTVIEYLDAIGGPMDAKLAKLFQRTLKKQGFEFHLKSKVTSIEKLSRSVKVTFEPRDGGAPTTLTADVVLVSVGRRAYADGLDLAAAGVDLDDRGRIVVDEHLRTACPTVWAVGDVIEGPMLAHKAEEEGVAVVERIVTGHGHVNYDALPGVIYTWPEVASVGLTEQQAKELGYEIRVGSFPFAANARAKTLDCDEGQIRMIADAETDRVLGVHILGPRASDILAEAVLAIEMEATSEDIARSFHGHPTLSEALREAALAVDGRVRQS